MTEQFTEIVVGVDPEVETVTPQWVVAEEYEKLQARIEELEAELATANAVNEMQEGLAELQHYHYQSMQRRFTGYAMGRAAALGQCTPSRNRTTGFGARLGRQIDLLLGL